MEKTNPIENQLRVSGESDPWGVSPSQAPTFSRDELSPDFAHVSKKHSADKHSSSGSSKSQKALMAKEIARSGKISHASQSDFSPKTEPGVSPHTPGSSKILDPRMTPIYVDGGNIISTKAGIYRLKMPMNDLDGNDRRRQERSRANHHSIHQATFEPERVQSPGYQQSNYGTQSDYEDDYIDPGSKSDSELLPSMRIAMEKRVKFSDGPPQISKVGTP